MLHNLLTLATCLSVAAALPAAAPELVERQTAPKGYGNNGTIVDAPPETDLSRPNFEYSADQLNQIKLAPTTGQKMAILKNLSSADDIFKFDLTPAGSKSNAGNGLGGVAFLAEASGFPVLMGTGISVAIGYLNPCGLDSIHLHNRATELVTLVKGTSLKAGFVMEDGFGKTPPCHALREYPLTLPPRPPRPSRDRPIPDRRPPARLPPLGVQRQL